MNKILSAVIGGFLGVTMATAIGVGMVVGSKAEYKEAEAAESTVTWTATAAKNLGSAIASAGGTATGSISTGSYSWNYTRRLVALKNKKTDNISFQGSTWIQLGSSNSLESLTLTTSAISGTIKNVSVTAATAGTHKLTITVGSTTYANAVDLTTYSGTAAATNPDPTNCVVSTNINGSGSISISIASSNTKTYKAMLIRSISVTYESSEISYTYSDTITRQTTGLPLGTGSYHDWSGKKLTSAAVYAGNSSAGNNAIQLRTTNNTSGIVTTTSGGVVKTIVLNFNTATTDGRKVQIYGKSSAYSSSADLFENDTKGTRITTQTYTAGTTSYTITPSSSYQFIGFRSSSDPLWLDSIVITWETTTQVAAPTSLTVTTQPETTTFGVGEKLNLKGLVVEDNNNVATINYSTSPAEAYVFTQADIGSKTITVTSLASSSIKTTFTVTVVEAFPVSITKTAPIAWDNNMTLDGGTARFKATLTDGSEVTNIKIGDSGTALIIDNVAVDTTVLANTYSGQWAKLTYTLNSRTAESAAFRIAIEDELLVDHFADVPEYILSGQTATINAHYTSFIGKPSATVEVSDPSTGHVTVSFNQNNVTYDTDTKVGEIPFTVTGGSVAGQYTIEVTITLNDKTASNTCSVIVRTADPGHEGSGDYELVTSLASDMSGKYVIAANVENEFYSMTTIEHNNKAGKFDEIEITVNSSNQITSSTFYVFTITKVTGGYTIQNSNGAYLKYAGGTGTNIVFDSNAHIWTISEIGDATIGTFKIESTTIDTNDKPGYHSIIYRTGNATETWNVFGGYKSSNIVSSKSSREYYGIELFKYIGSEEEDTGATEFELVKTFVDTYMHMDDIAITSLDNNNACMGANGLYATAKAGWNAMMSSYSGSHNLKQIFEDQFPDAYERYVTWAAKNGENETQAFNRQAFVPSNSQPTRVIDVNNNAMPAIIITISFVTVSTVAGYYLLKKKKQK